MAKPPGTSRRTHPRHPAGVPHRRLVSLACGLCLLTGPALRVQHAPLRLHFRPPDQDLGDVHPFFHEGECFLYYLRPGTFRSALVRSCDLVRWTPAPVTHGPAKPDDWFEPWFVLGVFRDGEVYRSFYGTRRGRMVCSVSRDLLHWSCAPKAFSVPPADYYHQRRDPFAFWIPQMKQFGCVMTTWIPGRPKATGGALSLATSPDLKQWKDHGPIVDPGDMGPPECPQMFPLGKRWHLLTSINEERCVGRPVYWTAPSPLGPWSREPDGALDGKDLCAAQVAFDGRTPLLFGWVPLTPARPGRQHWGGHLALPRELTVLPDGSLATRLPKRLRETLANLHWHTVPDFQTTSDPHRIKGRWSDLAAVFELHMPPSAEAVRVRIDPLCEVVLQRRRLRILDADGQAWSERDARIPSDRAVTVRLFVERDIVETFVAERFSLVARVPPRDGPRRMSVRSAGPGARIRAMRIGNLTQERTPSGPPAAASGGRNGPVPAR